MEKEDVSASCSNIINLQLWLFRNEAIVLLRENCRTAKDRLDQNGSSHQVLPKLHQRTPFTFQRLHLLLFDFSDGKQHHKDHTYVTFLGWNTVLS